MYGWDGIATQLKNIETNYLDFAKCDQVFDYYTPVFIANNSYLKKNAKEAKKEQPAKAEKETKKEQPAKDAKEKFSFGQIQELESKKRDENRRKGIDLGSQRLAKLAAQNGKRPPLPNRPLPPTPPHKNNGRTM